jgi:FkbM family methyltransferase
MIRKSRHGDFFIIDGGTHIDAWAEAAGRLDHDQNALPIILKHVPEGGCVVDAGAYCGDHAIAYLNKVGPTGQVFAFEPNPEAFEALRLNCPSAFAFNVALSDKIGTGVLIPASDTNYGACSVLPGIGSVEMIALDSLVLKKLHLFKLDCEGGEYDALLGASETIARCRPVIICEVNESALNAHDDCTPQHLLELITSFGYDVKNLYPRQDIGGPMCDVICLPLDRQPPQS